MYGLWRRDHVTPALHGLGWPTEDELIVDRDLANVRQILVSATAPELLRELFVLRADVSSRQSRAVADGHWTAPTVQGAHRVCPT